MTRSYGINERVPADNDIAAAVESLRTLGYAVVPGGYSADELGGFSHAFDAARRAAHAAAGGTDELARIDEHNTIRAPFAYERSLLAVARNPAILQICQELIGGYQILSQQNGVINPPATTYNQGAWHRDLPYQHVVFSRPMAINALFCLDAFTAENGATLVLPATHKQEAFPSDRFVEASAAQICAPAGSYIVLDCMLYHSGAANRSAAERRAINQVYTSPIIRQQIDLPTFLGDAFTDDPGLRRLLGYEVTTPKSPAEYFATRRAKLGR
jgi:ectoine hydroxylase-related dioxygenase (phytanoyl-CoA dioxygenase family)